MVKGLLKSKINKFMVLGISILLIVGMTGCKNEEVVAKVDDVKITKDELYDLLVQEYGEQVLNSLIGEKVVQLEIEKQNIEIKEEDIQKEIDQLIEYYGGEERFNEALKYQGYTMDDMKKSIEINMQIKKLLESDIEVSEEEITDFFEENKESLAQGEQVSARHILVETEEEAEDIRKKLLEGGDFAELAKEYSLDEGTKIVGGSLGYFSRGKNVQSFDDAAFSLEKGEISEPVKTDFGYHIIQVEDKKEAKAASLEEHRDDIERMLMESKIPEAYHKWYEEKYKEHNITNNLFKDTIEE
ncbi:MAG: peptidylprolyl isomerase [Tissierellaceae bacterium]